MIVPCIPCRVVLRNRETGTVIDRAGLDDTFPFGLMGRRDSGMLELWREDGRWREDGVDHPLDIMGPSSEAAEQARRAAEAMKSEPGSSP